MRELNQYKPTIKLSDKGHAIYCQMMSKYMKDIFTPDAPGYAAAEGINTLATQWADHATNGSTLEACLVDADNMIAQVLEFKNLVHKLIADFCIDDAGSELKETITIDNQKEALSAAFNFLTTNADAWDETLDSIEYAKNKHPSMEWRVSDVSTLVKEMIYNCVDSGVIAAFIGDVDFDILATHLLDFTGVRHYDRVALPDSGFPDSGLPDSGLLVRYALDGDEVTGTTERGYSQKDAHQASQTPAEWHDEFGVIVKNPMTLHILNEFWATDALGD